jgi:hypothetical protein
MSSKVVVLGASLGGLIASAELRSRGHHVTIIEKGQTVGGLYNKISTPFGIQELGMHVVYANDRHFHHLCAIFGEEVFHVLHGNKVDVGASANFDTVYFDSHYPSLLAHPLQDSILNEMLAHEPGSKAPVNALEEAIRRFGPIAANTIVAPILQKLWYQDPTRLSPQALHCFFDLRRLVVCNKPEADRLKKHPKLDEVIANPEQSRPEGLVFGGRMGLTFKQEFCDLKERVSRWATKEGVPLRFGKDVAYRDGELSVDGNEVCDNFDACIVTVPIHILADGPNVEADRLELSIYYFQLAKKIGDMFPSYYILAQDPTFRTSRIVNYDAYNQEVSRNLPSVIAIESIHKKGNAPTEKELIQELRNIMPALQVTQSYKLARSLTVFGPTLRNARLLDYFQQRITQKFGDKPIYFSGMRTDTGIFFSHNTIGLAYDSALACHEQLTTN